MQEYNGLSSVFTSAGANWTANTIKAILVGSGYTFSASHTYTTNVSPQELSGTGYTAGGYTLASKTATRVAANSFSNQRANSTAYQVGDLVRPATGNGYLYRCAVAGTTGGSPPTYGTVVGRETADGTVVWTNVGDQVLTLDAADVSQASVTLTGIAGVVLRDETADVLLGYFAVSPTKSPSAEPLEIVFDAGGIFHELFL